MDINPEDWKSGTEALALCSICGGEYEPTAVECPDCHVSLSIVRRCPECQKLVSAKHTRCVYCRTSFTHELAKPDSASPAPLGLPSRHELARRRFRAVAVSVGTFVVVFALGVLFLRMLKMPNGLPNTVAQTHVLDSGKLLSAPTYDSSIAGIVTSSAVLNITAAMENGHGRWMVLNWKGHAAYVAARDVAAPLVTDRHGGAEVLKFYLKGMDSSDAVDGARWAVHRFGKRFPHSPEADQLRWLLAGRIRILSRRGGARRDDLREQANALYRQLANGNGRFAARARAALGQDGAAPAASATEPARKGRRAKHHTQQIQVVGDTGIQVIGDTAERHQDLVLTQTSVMVRPGDLSGASAGTEIGGRVAEPIEANGKVAIPAGAPCKLKVVRAASGSAPWTLELLSVEIHHRAYAVRSSATEWHPGASAMRFALNAPLVIQR